MPAHERYAKPLALQPGRLQYRHEEPISVGSLLWVLTDPHRGHEFAYNRWYERDHYYGGCMIGAHTFAGSRWVATRRHKDARFPEGPRLGFGRQDGSYACLYWILENTHEEWLDWATPQVHRLYAADRGFAHRTHYNTGTYTYRWRAYRDADPIPLELALDRRYPGMVALFAEPAEGVTREQMDSWFDEYLPAWLEGSPVNTVSTWDLVPLREDKTDFVPDPRDAGATSALQIHFLDCDPLDAWDRYQALATDLQASGLGSLALASAWIPTVVGTDKYVDEIW